MTRVTLLIRLTVLGVLVGILSGSASALFLWWLEGATHTRTESEWLVYLLPLAGLGIGWVYARFGQPIQGGSDLLIDAIHAPTEKPKLPLRMAPMVLIGTVLTHLFGGSAGREGAAVQIGASLADRLTQWGSWVIPAPLRRSVLLAGVAGGFGSVFGTPIAGTVFAMEFSAHGKLEFSALWPALLAAVVGDMTTTAWGIHHTHYPAPAFEPITGLLLVKWCVFAGAVAATVAVFIEASRWLRNQSKRFAPTPKHLPLRMAVGGVLVVGLWRLVGTSDYLGLSVPLIERAFVDPDIPVYAFALKLLFTVVTLSAGFLGGEVTPLFCVGALLGGSLAGLLGLPLKLAAGVGMAAVFGVAANAPLALSLMAVELLGSAVLPHVLVVCALGYLLSGRRGIYHAQKEGVEKLGR